jgi:hypothetical protein
MAPYLVHPDKLAAVEKVVVKQKGKRAAKAKAQGGAKTPASGNLVLKLLQQAYLQRQATTGRSF